MIAPKLVPSSLNHAWAATAVVATMLVVAACDFPGTEQTAPPATPTLAAGPAATRLPPATVTVATVLPPAARAGVTPSPVTSPEAARLSRATTPAVPGWLAARATRGAGAVATAQAEVSATAQAEASATAHVEASATAHAESLATVLARATAIAEAARAAGLPHRHGSVCTTGLPMMPEYASNRSGNYGEVRWTADDAHILFTSGTRVAEVWAVTADGSRVWRIARAWGQAKLGGGSPSSFGWMTSFDITRGGKQVIYATCRYPPAVPRVSAEQLDHFDFDYELAVVGVDGQAPRRLTHHADFDNYPAWSPDGTRVAFVSDRGPGPWFGLYQLAADDPAVRRLGADLAVAGQPPAWSPDGRSIAVIGGREGDEGPGLYLVHADGTGFARLADAVSGGSWSPDGTRLAFAKREGAAVMLYTIAADGSDTQRVANAGGWQAGFGSKWGRRGWIPTIAWSPDGSKLLYTCGDRRLCVVTLDGQLVSEPCPGFTGGPVCYSPDGSQRVGTSLVGDRAAWSPDGARIAVTSSVRRHLVYNWIALYSTLPDGSDRQILAFRGVGGLVAAQAAEEGLATSRAACTAGLVVPAPEAHPGLVRDCETLLAARAALFGQFLVNWGSGSPLARWEGVTVAGSPPRVTGLDLRDRYLGFSQVQAHGGLAPISPGHGGTIPPALGALDHLQRLDLAGNRLTGPIPAELGQLTNLQQLYLAGNELTGCITVSLKRVPDHDLETLYRLPDCEAGS